MATSSVLSDSKIFVEISLTLILFDLGRHLDFRWLKHDTSLLKMSALECSLTLIMVYSFLYYMVGLPWHPSFMGAIVAVSTSPAVVMLVADDLFSEGPVTRRTLILTSMNNFVALVLFALFLPTTQADQLTTLNFAYQAVYLLLGSILLAGLTFMLAKVLAKFIGKHKHNQFVLFIGMLVVLMGLASTLKLSYMLTLFSLGVFARNFDDEHVLMEIDFKWLARLFIILLFVVTGVQLKLNGLWSETWLIILFVLIRYIAKSIGIVSFSHPSRLTPRQITGLTLTLTPMAGVALGMFTRLTDYNPNFNSQLIIILTSVVAILTILGPIMTQIGFIFNNEAHQENATN